MSPLLPIEIVVGTDKTFRLKNFPYSISGYSYSAAIFRRGQQSGSPLASFSVTVDAGLGVVTFSLSSAATALLAPAEIEGYIFETNTSAKTREVARLRGSIRKAGAV